MTARLRHDALIAIALAATLGAIWTLRDWSNLSALRLPDTDDIMRLQQVRDWIAGQSWFDLAQHRLGAGLQMHWSRLADLGPALLIRVMRPMVGMHAAEVVAVVIWPLCLFATALFLAARIARVLGGERLATTAAVVAAIAYPATTVFAPGRIDHHGSQVVLLLATLLATIGAPSPRRCPLAGAGVAASLIIGLETAPLLALIGGVILYDWIAGTDRDGERLARFGVGTFAGLVVGRIGFAGSGWHYPACDGFTLDAWTAAITLTAAPILLAGASGVVAGVRARALSALIVCGGASALAMVSAPDCAAPYGAVDPQLARLWLALVEEAQSILTAGVGHVVAYFGVMLAGLAAAIWCWRGALTRDRSVLLLLQTGAIMLAAFQLRGGLCRCDARRARACRRDRPRTRPGHDATGDGVDRLGGDRLSACGAGAGPIGERTGRAYYWAVRFTRLARGAHATAARHRPCPDRCGPCDTGEQRAPRDRRTLPSQHRRQPARLRLLWRRGDRAADLGASCHLCPCLRGDARRR